MDISTFLLYGFAFLAETSFSEGALRTGVIAMYAEDTGGGSGAGSSTKSRAIGWGRTKEDDLQEN